MPSPLGLKVHKSSDFQTPSLSSSVLLLPSFHLWVLSGKELSLHTLVAFFHCCFFLQTHRYFQCKSSHLWFWNSTLHPTSKIPLYFVAYCFLISIVVNLKMNMIGMSTLVAPFYIIFLDSQTRLENKMRLLAVLAWPQFWRTQLHSQPNGDFCPRIWTS